MRIWTPQFCPTCRGTGGPLCVATFRDRSCRYDGPETEDDKSFPRCRELGNEVQFMGCGRCPACGGARAVSIPSDIPCLPRLDGKG